MGIIDTLQISGIKIEECLTHSETSVYDEY